MKKFVAMIVALSLSIASGSVLAARYNPNQYYNGMTQNNVLLGRVLAVRSVQGSTGATNVGGLLGGIAGLALGNKVGRGAGRTIATVAGALMGGIFGSHLAQRFENRTVAQITVRLRDGRIIAVVEKQFQFQVGQKVQVIYSPGNGWGQSRTVRVLPL